MKICRSLLFMPGNNPGMLASAGVLGSDMVIFDLEDAVALTEKDAARMLVRHALTYARPERMDVIVRINDLGTLFWRDDVAACVVGGADYILLPKCSSPDDIDTVTAAMESAAAECGVAMPKGVMAIIESPLGMANIFAVAAGHPLLEGLLLGAEDLTAELGAKRTPKGDEILYARSRLLMACRAAGIKAIDCPFPFITDIEGLSADAAFAAQLGFDGKAVISPHHVYTVNTAFSPSEEQRLWAERVMAVADRAKKEGKGAVSLNGMMIDLPVIKRAENILARVCATESCHA